MPDQAPATYRSILVAVDGSRSSLAALRHAVGLARGHHARLSVVAVAPAHPTMTQTMAAMSGWAPEPPERWMAQELRKAVASLPADQPVTTYLRLGTAAKEIVSVAVEGLHDLIVIGTRGGHPFTSVSRRVVRHSPIPVVVVQEPPARRLKRRRWAPARAAAAALPPKASPRRPPAAA